MKRINVRCPLISFVAASLRRGGPALWPRWGARRQSAVATAKRLCGMDSIILLATAVALSAAQSKLDGDAQAKFERALAYAEGTGMPRDPAKAFELFRAAAERGHAKAEQNLGTMSMQELGAEKDAPAALTWFKKAAEQGIAPSQDTLGQMYLSGTGTKKDCREAAR